MKAIPSQQKEINCHTKTRLKKIGCDPTELGEYADPSRSDCRKYKGYWTAEETPEGKRLEQRGMMCSRQCKYQYQGQDLPRTVQVKCRCRGRVCGYVFKMRKVWTGDKWKDWGAKDTEGNYYVDRRGVPSKQETCQEPVLGSGEGSGEEIEDLFEDLFGEPEGPACTTIEGTLVQDQPCNPIWSEWGEWGCDGNCPNSINWKRTRSCRHKYLQDGTWDTVEINRQPCVDLSLENGRVAEDEQTEQRPGGYWVNTLTGWVYVDNGIGHVCINPECGA